MSQKNFALVKTGGKQYRIEPGAVVEIEKMDKNIGETFEYSAADLILVVKDGKISDTKNAVIVAQVVRHFRGEKVIAFRKQRRTSGFTKKHGHRQDLTAVLIKEIR